MTEKLTRTVNIVLLGAPGAGKGTQASILVKAYGLLHISTGDMLRNAIKEGTETGLKAQEYMNRGELVPDEIVTQLVVDRMGQPDAERGVILDGFPRTEAQAVSLDSALEKDESSLDIVLYVRVSDDVVIKRLSGRRLCPNCGKIYHVTNMPPEKEGICDKCGSELIQRDDDKAETVKKRLEVYKNSTKDLIDYYKRQGLLVEVDGDLEADELFEDIDSLFRKKGLIDDSSDQ
ncbi:MAG: adenylate kinase [Candidatus Omnitrophica bacterium]|nr:adenylate kinase [Candidatus Omnitrophota bacterium]